MAGLSKGRGVGTSRSWARALISLGFLVSAGLHFTATDTEARLIPEFLPWRRELVLISGAAEVRGAIGLLYSPTRKASAYGLVALLIAVFPANINHAVQNIQLGGFMDSRVYQWGRLPFQALFIWAALWSAKPEPK